MTRVEAELLDLDAWCGERADFWGSVRAEWRRPIPPQREKLKFNDALKERARSCW